MSRHEECVILVQNTDTGNWKEVLELPSGELYLVAAGLGTVTIVGSRHRAQLLARTRSQWPGAGQVRIENTGSLTEPTKLDPADDWIFTLSKQEVYEFCLAEYGIELTDQLYHYIECALRYHMRATWEACATTAVNAAQ